MKNLIIIKQGSHGDSKELSEKVQKDLLEKHVAAIITPPGITVQQLPFNSAETAISNVRNENNMVLIQITTPRENIQKEAKAVQNELTYHDIDSVILPMDTEIEVIRA